MARRPAARSRAAYSLVDLSDLDKKTRDQIIDDANAGGHTYGVRVVEEAVNGPARQPVFGVYEYEKDLWEQAKENLGISASEVDDDEVRPMAVTTPDDEARLRERAREIVGEQAERIRTAEEDELRQIVGEDVENDGAAAEAAAQPNADRTTGRSPGSTNDDTAAAKRAEAKPRSRNPR